MYFAAWSHNVIASAVNLSNDLKMGEYRTFPPPHPACLAANSFVTVKIPPQVMFLTQICTFSL